jgi:photosystem II stability/assembly factor-like uncharacterized protein
MKKFTIAVFALMLMTANLFAQTWTAQTSPVATDLNSIWAVNDQVVWACGPSGVVLRTTNGGTSWALANTGLTGNDFYTVCAIDANNCWVGAGDGGLWHTTNGGTAWTFVSLSPATPFVDVVHFFDANNGFALGDPSASQWRYYITSNGGTTWTLGANAPASVGTEAGWNNSYDAIDTGHIWWGTNVTKIYKGGFRGPFSSGATTQPNSYGIFMNNATTGVASMTTSAPAVAPNNVTTDGGTTWTASSYTPAGVGFALRGIHGTGYCWMGMATGIIRSTNSGTTWTSQFTSANAIYGLTFYSQGLGWACTATGKIYKYVDPTFTGVSNNNQTHKDFTLGQNYPNPFNPTTTINYSIPKASNVTIKLYDMLGHEVMSLVNGFQTSGNHTAFVDATSLASGVYVYKMTAGDFSDVKRMTLVK